MKRSFLMTMTLLIFASVLTNASLASSLTAQEKQAQFLKKQIIKTAQRATEKIKFQNEYSPATRKILEPLIAELASITPKKPVTEQLVLSVGAWKNVWSDLPFTKALASQIYQVVFPTGYYYNIARYEDKEGIYTTYLRGAYRLESDKFAIRFTKSVRDFVVLGKGSDLYQAAMIAELGVFDGNLDPNNQESLNQPFELTTVYIDKDLRIVRGVAFDGGQIIRPLFVLVPQTAANK